MKWLSLVERYLHDRRNLGYSLTIDGRVLKGFGAFSDTKEAPWPLELPVVLEWARLAPSGSEIAIARRIGIVRAFSLYLHTIDSSSPVIPVDQVGRTHRRLPPYIYNQNDVLACLQSASQLLPAYGIRPLTIQTLLGLLVSSGLRPGEAVRLRRDDVNLEAGELTVNHSKNWSRRLVPVDSSTTEILYNYRSVRDLFQPLTQSDSFFLMDDGQGLNIEAADYAFDVIRRQLGLRRKFNGRFPRLYDFRHTFVCRRVQSWYECGVDVNLLIPELSRYIGHKKIEDTYWYLTSTPELMGLAAQRFTAFCDAGGDV